MRRSDREVTNPGEIAEIMSRCEVVRLAMNDETVPYILPLNFGMEPDGMTIYIHGAMTGTKYDVLAKDKRVSFEMDCTYGMDLNEKDHECSIFYESVIGWGIVEELTEESEKRHALTQLMRQYHAENFSFDDRPLPRTRILRLNVKARTAKRRVKLF